MYNRGILYLNVSNTPFCTPQWGWYRMDWRRGHWMMFYLWYMSSMIASGVPVCCSGCSVWYFMIQTVYIGSYIISECTPTFSISQGSLGWMDAFG